MYPALENMTLLDWYYGYTLFPSLINSWFIVHFWDESRCYHLIFLYFFIIIWCLNPKPKWQQQFFTLFIRKSDRFSPTNNTIWVIIYIHSTTDSISRPWILSWKWGGFGIKRLWLWLKTKICSLRLQNAYKLLAVHMMNA